MFPSDRIEQYARIAQNITIIFGIVGGVLSLLIAQQDKRVQRSLDFYKDYTVAVRNEFLDLDQRWTDLSAKYPDFLTRKIDDQRKITDEFFQAAENRRKLTSIVTFFDALYICIDNRACDRNTALDLMGPTAGTMFEMSGHFIQERRHVQRTNSVGRGLEQIYRLRRERFFERYL
jgi:hypothetical protein